MSKNRRQGAGGKIQDTRYRIQVGSGILQVEFNDSHTGKIQYLKMKDYPPVSCILYPASFLMGN
jgi:hypothetical protein